MPAITMASLLATLACRREPDTSGVLVRSNHGLTLVVGVDGGTEPVYEVSAIIIEENPKLPKARQCSDESLWQKGVLTVNWHVDHDCSVRLEPLAHVSGRELHMMVQTIPADVRICPLVAFRDHRYVQKDNVPATDVQVRSCFNTAFHNLPAGIYEIVRPDRKERFIVP